MKLNTCIRLLPATALALFPSCIDTDFDLSDIDTTVKLDVVDLVVPMNMDPVTLGDILDPDQDSKVQVVTIGDKTFYAVTEKGEFSSDPVAIPGFATDRPAVQPSLIKFGNTSQSATLPAFETILPLAHTISTPVSFSATGIDDAIVGLSSIGLDDFSITLTFTLSHSTFGLTLQDVLLTIPDGFKVTSILPSGTLPAQGSQQVHIKELDFVQGTATATVTASRFDVPAGVFDASSHSLSYSSAITLSEAKLKVTSPGGSVPAGVDLNIDYNVSPIKASDISGRIQYSLQGAGLDIAPITLDDLPDFLAGPETDIKLSNPQIYLSLNNPVAAYGLDYSTGLEFTSVHASSSQTFAPDNGAFTVGSGKGIAGPYNFCLSPDGPRDVPAGFSDPQHVPFSTFGGILSGNGLPERIDIRLVDPQIRPQDVSGFALGTSLQPVQGKWEFVAPLSMDGSTIVYSDRKDGWNNEEVAALTVTTLTLTCTVDNNTSLQAALSAYPVNSKGEIMTGVEIKSTPIAANTRDQKVSVTMTGTATDLDGIEFRAVMHPKGSETLQPGQTIDIRDIRAKVSGYYLKEL